MNANLNRDPWPPTREFRTQGGLYHQEKNSIYKLSIAALDTRTYSKRDREREREREQYALRTTLYPISRKYELYIRVRPEMIT